MPRRDSKEGSLKIILSLKMMDWSVSLIYYEITESVWTNWPLAGRHSSAQIEADGFEIRLAYNGGIALVQMSQDIRI